MKRVIIAALVFLFFATTVCANGIIGIVPTDTPDWAVSALKGDRYWFTSRYAYAIGVAPKMRNASLQRTTAENRARAALVKGLGISTGIAQRVEIRDHWEDPVTHELYALARIEITIVPAEK